MTVWHKSLKSRINDFFIPQQLLMVCNELNRAQNFLNSPIEYHNALERALEICDFCSDDPKWSGNMLKEFRRGRSVIAQMYIDEAPQSTQLLQDQLIGLSSECWKMTNRPVAYNFAKQN